MPLIVGDVTIEERASVWYNAVLRGDFNPIVVHRGPTCRTARWCTSRPAREPRSEGARRSATTARSTRRRSARNARSATARRCSTACASGARAMVAAGALGTPETEISEGMLALGTPAKVRGPLAGTPVERWVRASPEGYQALAQRYKASVKPC